MKVRPAVLAASVVLAAPVPALAAAPFAELRGPDGSLIASATEAPFAYPADGSVLQVDRAAATTRGLELRGVSLLGGRVRAAMVRVPARGLAGAAIEGLTVGGRVETGGANALLSLGGASYLVALQQAIVPGSGSGVVGLRVYIGDAQAGVPDGTQLLVGLARVAVRPREKPAASWNLLGVAPEATPKEVAGAFPGGADPFPGVADPFAALRAPSPIGVRAVAIAEQYLGIPYVWAGADPLTGFDCSGLIMYVYRQLGIGLTHFTGSQWYAGRRVPTEELAPGDLVFFDMESYGPGHEGLYIGRGKFIEAPHSGAVVRISSLFDPARGLSYVGAVRPYS